MALSVFVDTAGWMTLADVADPGHARAARFRDQWLEQGGTFVSTDYVMDETLTLHRRIERHIDALRGLQPWTSSSLCCWLSSHSSSWA